MAGVSTKEIKNRIRSMESTKQITKAMEMVAASKLRKAQAQVSHSRPYFEMLYDVIRDIVSMSSEPELPYMTSHGTGRTAYVVIGGDRGLAGGFNSNIFKACYREMIEQDVKVLPVGRKASEFFKARGVPLIHDHYAKAEAVGVGDCFSMARALCREFRAGEYDRVCLGYTHFVSLLSQRPVTMPVLPLLAEKKEAPKEDIVYEPDPFRVYEAIIPEYVGGVIYGALCESRASEQAARRAAMDTATQNAEEMIADLSLKYNQARQAAITQEITEIVAGV